MSRLVKALLDDVCCRFNGLPGKSCNRGKFPGKATLVDAGVDRVQDASGLSSIGCGGGRSAVNDRACKAAWKIAWLEITDTRATASAQAAGDSWTRRPPMKQG